MGKYSFSLVVVAVFINLCFWVSCKPDSEIAPAQEFSFHIPEGWPQPVYNFENNTLSQKGFNLGKRLFFDPILSRTHTVSCGSCHQQFSAFAHKDHNVSHGVDDLLGTRNAPPLFNLNWHPEFFWDGGVNHIENQPINPIQNPVEMDETLENVLAKLQADSSYRAEFAAVFGDETINTQRVFKAIAQYMGMLLSTDAPYDQYMRQEASLSDEAIEGMKVFNKHCATCHKPPLFTDFSYRNNGIAPTIVNDSGRALITRNVNDLYKFKVPSLRNLKYTPPYMHDGRFNTLEEVLDHYATGIHQSATLDPQLISGIQLSKEERSYLLAFLYTLNDEHFVTNPLYKE